MSSTDRDIRQSSYMSDTEAMMWAAERDPFLSSGMGSVFTLDQSPDVDRLVEAMLRASKAVLRLREKVVEGILPAPPRWVIDESFDIRDHIISVRLPAPATQRELLDLAAFVISEPFDKAKPLWKFVAVMGSKSRRKDAVKGAIVMKLHHSISDGIGAMRLAELYMDLERNPPPKPPLPDLAPAENVPEDGLEAVVADVGHLVKRQLTVARRTAAEVALWGADPSRMKSAASEVAAAVRSVANQAVGDTSTSGSSGSELWRTRSSKRHYEAFDLPLADLKGAAARLGGSINDVFVAGTVIAASRYHRARDAEVGRFNLSFIISTRSDDAAGGNSFAPVPFSVDATPRTDDEMCLLVKQTMAEKRKKSEQTVGDSMEVMATVANALPSSVLTKIGRARSAKIDWATSNLRAADFPVYVAGAEITHMYPIGPLGGTAFNLTAMSYNGSFDFGLFVDPVAVEDPVELRDHLKSSYQDLIKGGT